MATCLNCATIFTPHRDSFGKYCSNKCRAIHQRPDFDCLKTDSRRKARLIEDRGWVCENCRNTEWLGNPIPLDLEHKDGNYLNNSKENLSLLCCNCHALTDTYKGKNKGKGRKDRQ